MRIVMVVKISNFSLPKTLSDYAGCIIISPAKFLKCKGKHRLHCFYFLTRKNNFSY